jgi:hypothetical protein
MTTGLGAYQPYEQTGGATTTGAPRYILPRYGGYPYLWASAVSAIQPIVIKTVRKTNPIFFIIAPLDPSWVIVTSETTRHRVKSKKYTRRYLSAPDADLRQNIAGSRTAEWISNIRKIGY